jgi:hypothetical protein
MAVPWFRLIDTVVGLVDLVRSSRRPQDIRGDQDVLQALEGPAPKTRSMGGLEMRLAGVVVAALKEAFERDGRRLEFEREHFLAEQARAERLLQLELQRQAADREIARLRLMAGVAAGSWIGTLFFSSRLLAGGAPARIALAGGWVLLLAALALAFVAQSRVAAALHLAGTDDVPRRPDDVSSGVLGAIVPWLIVAGLAVVAGAALVA